MEKTFFFKFYSAFNVTFYVFICFHLVALTVALKLRFAISSHAINTQLDIFKRDFTKPSFKHAKKNIFRSVAFLYSLSKYFLISKLFLPSERIISSFMSY